MKTVSKCLWGVLAVCIIVPRSWGAISDLTWGPVETVDSPVATVSGSGGVSVLGADTLWHVAYEKSGEIYVRKCNTTGWQPAEQLSDDPNASISPHMARGGGFLHVVWEDDRTGHSEVWTRRFDGGWSSEECLSCDSIPSAAPVIGGDGDLAYVAWEELQPAASAVLGRRFSAGSWAPAESVSASHGAAFEPSVRIHPGLETVSVVWSDTRTGGSQIFRRAWDAFNGWSDEEQLTDLPGACRRPSIAADNCCPDLAYPAFGLSFENDQEGVFEIYALCSEEPTSSPELMSSDDGIPSVRPNLDVFTLVIAQFPFPPTIDNYILTWTDSAGVSNHVLSRSEACFDAGQSDTALVSAHGLSFSVAGAVEGMPDAEVMVAWVEEREGVPTLLAQRGTLLGYVPVEGPAALGDPPRLTVAPNPASAMVMLRLDLPARAPVEVRVVDASGRLVRDLGSAPAVEGSRLLRWDLRDGRGRRVSSGRYVAVARVGGDAPLREMIYVVK